MLVRPLMTDLKTTVRDDYAISACRPPHPNSVYKPSHPLLMGVGGVGLWTDVCHLPHPSCHPPAPQLPVSEIKQTFLSTTLPCLLAFE